MARMGKGRGRASSTVAPVARTNHHPHGIEFQPSVDEMSSMCASLLPHNPLLIPPLLHAPLHTAHRCDLACNKDVNTRTHA
jgi:hypothetical protein